MNLLTLSELKSMQEQGEDFLLLNVLSEELFQKGHIPNSLNAPVSATDFLESVAALTAKQGKNQRIVTYCGGFQCNASRNAANQLTASGYSNVSAYEGGMEEWIAAGYPVTGDGAECAEESCCG